MLSKRRAATARDFGSQDLRVWWRGTQSAADGGVRQSVPRRQYLGIGGVNTPDSKSTSAKILAEAKHTVKEVSSKRLGHRSTAYASPSQLDATCKCAPFIAGMIVDAVCVDLI